MWEKCFARISREAQSLRKAKVTAIFLIVIFSVQALPLWLDISLSQLQLILGLSSEQPRLFQSVSYTLIHGNWMHLILNSLALIIMGSKVESYISQRFFCILLASAMLAGGFVFLLLSPAGSEQVLVGASSMTLGLLTFLTTVSPESRLIPFFLPARWFGFCAIWGSLSLAIAARFIHADLLPLFAKSYVLGVSHSCHFGGAVMGWLCARYLLRKRVSLATLQRARAKRETQR